MDQKTLTDITTVGIRIGTIANLANLGVLKPFLSYTEATDTYGRRTVDRWIKVGLIKKIKDGKENSKVRLSRVQLETLATTANRDDWFETKVKNEDSNKEI